MMGRKKRVTESEAQKLLGNQWRVNAVGRPNAELVDVESVSPECPRGLHYRRGLHTWTEMSESITTLAESKIVLEMMWPTHLSCRVDLADFYWDKNQGLQHPLNGHQIPELVKATNYPFNFPDRVRVIPATYLTDHLIQLGVDKPSVVIFVEPWSHYDAYDSSACRSPEEAFTPDGIKYDSENFYQFSDPIIHIGCNFLILPVGYDYELHSGNGAAAEAVSKENAEKWQKILQDFFNNENIVAEQVQNPTCQPPVGEEFSAWQQSLRDVWKPLFFSDQNIERCKKVEVFIRENEDLSAVLIYKAALPKGCSENSATISLPFETMERVNGFWYHVASFAYCQVHFTAFKTLLDNLLEEYYKARDTMEENN